MSIHVPNGDSITASGSGTVDFSSNAAQLAVQYAGLPQLNGTQLREVIVGGSLYLSMPGISQLASGKSWVSTPLGTNSITPGSSNPGSMLQLLASQGNTVTPLGPSTIEGTAVHGYNVVISTADLSRELSRLNLPASLDQQMQAVFGSAGIRMTVYVGDANDLIRQVGLHHELVGRRVDRQRRRDRGHHQLRRAGGDQCTAGRPGTDRSSSSRRPPHRPKVPAPDHRGAGRRSRHRAGCYFPVCWRCAHPGQQQGRRWPSSSSSPVRRMRRCRVVPCLASSTQQMNSLRARGVMSFQASSAVGLAISALRRSAGSLCTTPPGSRGLLTRSYGSGPGVPDHRDHGRS